MSRLTLSGCRHDFRRHGRFAFHGFAKPQFQFQALKDGYVFINWGVKVEDDGIHWHEVGEHDKKGTMKQFVVTLTQEAWIEGRTEMSKPDSLSTWTESCAAFSSVSRAERLC